MYTFNEIDFSLRSFEAYQAEQVVAPPLPEVTDPETSAAPDVRLLSRRPNDSDGRRVGRAALQAELARRDQCVRRSRSRCQSQSAAAAPAAVTAAASSDTTTTDPTSTDPSFKAGKDL